MEDDSMSVIINSHYKTNLNEIASFFLYITFSQLFRFAEMIRGDKNDLISLAVLLFLVAVYAYHQQNQQTLLACCACWPQCMIAVRLLQNWRSLPCNCRVQCILKYCFWQCTVHVWWIAWCGARAESFGTTFVCCMEYEIFVWYNKSINFSETAHTMKQETYVSWNTFRGTH